MTLCARPLVAIACLSWVCCCATVAAYGQAVRAAPYNAQLRSDPDVGNIQGIQRYGRPLKTDPDQGEGYSYYVHPVGYPEQRSAMAVAGQAESAGNGAADSRDQVSVAGIERQINNLQRERNRGNTTDTRKADIDEDIAALEKVRDKYASDGEPRSEQPARYTAPGGFMAQFQSYGAAPESPYPPPFDATAGIRSWGSPDAPRQLPSGSIFNTVINEDGTTTRAAALNKVKTASGGGFTTGLEEVYHQPLIQVRMRIVEIVRDASLQAQSILEYISTTTGKPSLISTNSLSKGKVGQEALTRFPLSNATSPLLGVAANNTLQGTSGGLVNLTSKHLNWVASFLATEFQGDVITAPEVVTLNGQNVEFVAGSKIPFELGQNVTTGATTNIQQFFYKSVGTYVSVTPRIVNWGLHGEGGGQAPLADAEVADWNLLIHWMLTKTELASRIHVLEKAASFTQAYGNITQYGLPGTLVPIEMRTELLQILKAYPRDQIAFEANRVSAEPVIALRADCDPCHWRPQDCTIDLSLVVRLSDPGTTTKTKVSVNGSEVRDEVTIEDNVRAIANVVQVKSGHGAAIGGLIGTKEVNDITKVPVLGDIPVVGFLFRSKSTNRQKTELLIFIEARVLDRHPGAARGKL